MTDKIVVFCTCADEPQALQLARELVGQQLAACVNILNPIRSVYRWHGEVTEDTEFLLVIKSRRDCFEALRDAIRKLHSYQVPEVIAIPIVDGSSEYLEWLDHSLTPAAPPPGPESPQV